MEGQDPGQRLRHALRGHSLLSSREEPRADGSLAGDRRQEEYVDALFRELEKDPVVLLLKRRVGPILLGMGLVLILVGLLAIVWVQAPELLLSWVLGVNVLAVLCVAAGILLLPERSTPSPAGPGEAGGRDGFRFGRVRFPRPLLHFHIGHARQ